MMEVTMKRMFHYLVIELDNEENVSRSSERIIHWIEYINIRFIKRIGSINILIIQWI